MAAANWMSMGGLPGADGGVLAAVVDASGNLYIGGRFSIVGNVLATNVAETSLTVPGIRYVIDAGLARVKRYSLRNKTTLLQIEKISQAAANQRAGRCGRVADGICVRLYDEEDFAGNVKQAADDGNDDRIVQMCKNDLGLNVKVVRDTQIKLRADDAITQCEQCGRILHLVRQGIDIGFRNAGQGRLVEHRRTMTMHEPLPRRDAENSSLKTVTLRSSISNSDIFLCR